MDVLDERKEKILNTIIRNYLETGEPVGSRTISKSEDINLSSATIRNEMSDLEEMGYILQPHTSAGRIPSDKGYRFYVDHLMMEKDREISEMKELVIEQTEKTDKVLKSMAKLLASGTNYTTMITAPKKRMNTVKFIQLSMVGEDKLLAVVVLDGNLVRNKMIDIEEELSPDELLKLNMLFNTTLNGLSAEEINLSIIAGIKAKADIESEIVNSIFDAISDTINEGKDLEIYTSGATNIFNYPELSDSERAAKLLTTIEDKDELAALIPAGNEDAGIKVYIGDESPIENMKDCSIVTATYKIGDDMTGTVGIIGPKRMDYENVVENLKQLKVKMKDIFNKDG